MLTAGNRLKSSKSCKGDGTISSRGFLSCVITCSEKLFQVPLHSGISKSLYVVVHVSLPFASGWKEIVASHLDNASNHHFEQSVLSGGPLPEVQCSIPKPFPTEYHLKTLLLGSLF